MYSLTVIFWLEKDMKTIAIYARVSTDKQSTENQLLELRTLCTKLDLTIVQEYTDNGISGTKCHD